MSTSPPAAKFPWVAAAGILVLALAGVGMLAFAFITLLSEPAAPAATVTPLSQPSASTQQVVAIPTTTPAPPTATLAPTEPPTVEATTAPAASPTSALALSIVQPANVRSGPGLTYPILGGLNSGTTASLLGRDSSAQWFAVQFEGATGGIGWVSQLVSSYSGDTNALPVIEASAPPPPPQATAPPATSAPPTAPLATAPPATAAPTAVSGSRGIVANYFRVRNTSAGVSENIWFEFQVTNTSGSDVPFAILAAHTDVGFTAESWNNDTLSPNEVLTWEDHINIGKAGTYQVYLGICYGDRNACMSGANPWDRLSTYVTVTVQ